MEDIFKIIDEMSKDEQFNTLLEMLQEVSENIQFIRIFSKNPLEDNMLTIEQRNAEIIKEKLKQLYNENIPKDELHVQNIAQP